MQSVGWVLLMALQLYLYILIARMIVSWVPLLAPQWRLQRLLASLFEIIYTLTDPPIKLLRRVIPPLNLGGVSLDLAFMAVFLLILVLQRVISAVFF